MHHKRTLTTLTIAMAAFSAIPALAQSAAPGQRDLAEQQSGLGQTSRSALTENFDSDPVDGWEYSCEHDLLPVSNGRALGTVGGGHAIWVAAGPVSDFTLQLSYGFETGVGDIFFRDTATSSGHEFYCLRLEPNQVVLSRRPHVQNGNVPEKQLAAAPVPLAPKSWHDVVIRAVGGQVAVAINGQIVLSVNDPQPLRSGLCGLGVIADSGLVLYDDVQLIREDQPNNGGAQTKAVNWP